MKTNNKNAQSSKAAIKRYGLIFILITIGGFYILLKAMGTMYSSDREYWNAVSNRFVTDSIIIKPVRGNILTADGKVLSASIPVYELWLDLRVGGTDSIQKAKTLAFRDSLFYNNIDSIADGLARIFPDWTAERFKKHLLDGKKSNRWALRVYPKKATYMQYKECKKLPLFRESSFKGGFHGDEEMLRSRPYDKLAFRTIGDLRSADSAKFGLEFYYDSILRGKPGIKHRTNVRNERLNFIDQEAVNGNDIVTTLDIALQDFAEQTLRKKLMELSGTEQGVAVVMEVATGDVKAIVNLSRANDGNFYEMENLALSALWEPGSTFKTASILTTLDNGYIKENDEVQCGNNGLYQMYGRTIRDHNWRKGGYGTLSVSGVLEQSSNIGTARLVDRGYHDEGRSTERAEQFIADLNAAGVGIDLELQNMKGLGKPVIPSPRSTKRYWSKTDLPWMSFGYVTQLPPICTLTFYNAIANNGRMVKPRFVTAEMKDGKVVKEYPTEVLRESIVKNPKTIEAVQGFLYNVVHKGLGGKAGCKYFDVSGKTGTAQMNYGRGGGMKYMVSFCGFYPSEAPKYSCIVCIVKTGPASGGAHCGPVFSEIAQYAMSCGMSRSAALASDSTSVTTPSVAASLPDTIAPGKMPDVTGMGAKDATFELQKRGLKVVIKGMGRVKRQSIQPGAENLQGKTVTLTLE